jgi:hypothetical protein
MSKPDMDGLAAIFVDGLNARIDRLEEDRKYFIENRFKLQRRIDELVGMVEGLLPFAKLAFKPGTEAHAKLAVKMAEELLARVRG